VISFEPVPANCDIFRKNVAINGLQNVILVPQAVGDSAGVVHIDAVSNAAVKTKGGAIEVTQTFIDTFAHLGPTVLKIDVEGFEHRVLLGARKVLATRPRIALELHGDDLPLYGSSAEQVLDMLRPYKYQMWLQREDGTEPVEYDGVSPIFGRVHLFCV